MVPQLLTPDDAAMMLHSSRRTLEWWRTVDRGPKYVRLGRRVFYREGDLAAFISAGECIPAEAA